MIVVVDKAPVKLVTPCEGTGFEIGAMSIIKGARNLDNARKFFDWALTPQAQTIGLDGTQRIQWRFAARP